MNAIAWKPSKRRALKAALIAFAVFLAGALYVALVGVGFDVSHRGRELAKEMSARLGREVRFDGPLILEISARPKLRLRDLVVANPPGFTGDPLARLGELRLQLNLWWLLRLKVYVEELAGNDIAIHLRSRSVGTNAGGANNWTFSHAGADMPPSSPDSGDSSLQAVANVLSLLDVGKVTLEKLRVAAVGADGKAHHFALDALAFHWLQGESFRLSLRGTAEKTFPYTLELSGGSLDTLARGGTAWPFDAQLAFLSTTARFTGEIEGNRAHMSFGLGTEDHAEIERLLQIDIPDVGAIGIAGELAYRPGNIAFTHLNGVIGRTTLTGAIEYDFSGARPALRGELDLPSLDLRPFMIEHPDPSAAPPRTLAELYRDIAGASFSLKSLAAIDVDARLKVNRWMSLPGDIRDTALSLSIRNGRLRMPLKTTIAGVPLAGEATADTVRAKPQLHFALVAKNSSLGGLGELAAGAKGAAGRLDSLAIAIDANGDTGAEIIDTLAMRFEIENARLSYGNTDGARPVDFRLERFTLAWPAGKPLSGDARGSLLGHPLSISLRGAPLATLMREGRTPLEFEARAENVRARIHGVFESPTENAGSELEFELNAPHAGEVASWFGFASGADANFAVSGKFSTRRSAWNISDFRLRLGRSLLSGDLGQSLIDSRPLTKLKLLADPIDVGEIESLMPKSGSASNAKPDLNASAVKSPSTVSSAKTTPTSAVLDIPILPQGISLADADIDVDIKRVAGTPVEIRDIAFDGRIREGAMQPSKFSASIAGIGLNGTVAVDLRGAEPQASLELAADAVDIGGLLRKLQLAKDIDAQFDHTRIQLTARASRLGELLARSELKVEIAGGKIAYRDPDAQSEMRVAISDGLLSALPGMPVGLSLQGAIDLMPVVIGIETARAQDLANPKLPFPFKLVVAAAESAVNLAGTIARPVGAGDIELALDAFGPGFNRLNGIARTSLPPWGPWSASGRFLMSRGGYRVNKLRLQVGESTLSGHGALEPGDVRPRLDVALHARNIQLDDFRLGDWSPVKKKKPAPQAKPLADDEAKLAGEVDDLLGRETLRRMDASIVVEVDQVLSGKDQLGNGRIEAKLDNGVATLGPAEVKLPGGAAKLSLLYEPGEKDNRMELRIAVDHLDYGVIARHIDPNTEQKGIASLRVEVDARAGHPSEIFRHGNGRIDFALWPENMKSGVIDLWAVNLLAALLPTMDSGEGSKVNCAIGRFTLKDGKLNERIILLDTSRMRVTGDGSADFGAESLHFHLQPRAKAAEFLSLAIPIDVTGTFEQYHIGVAAPDVVESLGRFATSVLWVPFVRLFGESLPEQGSDVCSAPDLSSNK